MKIMVRKSARVLEVLEGGSVVRSYRVSLGFAAAGDKETEGDGRMPEGEFYICAKNDKSSFHLSLCLSYPNAEDAARGLAAGLIGLAEHDAILDAIATKRMPPQKTKLGGEIYIHGGGLDGDWTKGCAALKNDEIEELFAMAAIGTSVTIVP